METQDGGVPRRQVVKAAATAGAVLGTLPLTGLRAQGTARKLKVALVGCGGRGSGAIENHMDAVKVINDKLSLGLEVQAVATGDFSKGNAENVGKRWGVPADKCFGGPTAYQKVIESGPDMILFATPTCFRPVHVSAAIAAGRNVFMEKPCAVDPPGIRKVLAAYEEAKMKGLTVVAGTQRRHSHGYNERWQAIKEGLFGRILGGRVSWCMGKFFGEKPINPTKPEDLIGQGKWWCWNMISGDHIVEQHVHNIDVVNWAFGATPVKVMGMGGRQVRTAPEYGNIFDHFAVEFEYPNGARVMSMCRQTPGCADRVEEKIVGTKGHAFGYGEISGPNAWKFEGDEPDPYVVEHTDLIASIRDGKPLNEGKRVAESTLCAIMGRMSAYTGRAISWDWAMNASKLDLTPAKFEFGPNPVDPVAVPGKTPLI
jgi:predicted dehydrogenase